LHDLELFCFAKQSFQSLKITVFEYQTVEYFAIEITLVFYLIYKLSATGTIFSVTTIEVD